MMKFRTANGNDAGTLSAIAILAKAHWGYPSSWLKLWEKSLTVTIEQVQHDTIFLCELQKKIVGFIGISTEGNLAEIEHLWVLPEFMSRGIGRALFKHALQWCRANAIDKLKVVSDPNALGFYQALGGKIVGEEPSIPQPRVLPVLEFSIDRPNASAYEEKKNMKIRSAQTRDIETLFEIRTSVIENHQSREEIAALGITPDSVARMLQTDCRAWIAEVEGETIGFSIANATEKTIFGIFVLPAFEGRGAGRALMQRAEEWLWSQGIEEIWLLTGNDRNLRAYGFYLHLGWTPVGIEADGVTKGEMKFIKKRQV